MITAETYLECLHGQPPICPEIVAEVSSLLDLLKKHCGKKDWKRMRRILLARAEDKTYDEIARSEGVIRQRIRQIESSALFIIRRFM